MVKKAKSIPLTQAEAAFLISGGALGVEADHPVHSVDALITAEYAQLVETALSEDEVAEKLNVSINWIRQCIKQGSLYAIESPRGIVFPSFQFIDNAVLPGLEVVLGAIDKQTHPAVVQRFFLTPTADLESTTGDALSPRDWLISGYPPDPVVVLATEP